mmetsp:Transcript_15376/g.20030  ORF Transcript_15376/g.20030 Transcript_15376/m.20030 type:complete len:131 (+) Transcript_15376:870-1262(+)
MGYPPFIVTGCVGAVGRMNFTYGNLEARCSATSTQPSEVSPNPCDRTMAALCVDGFFGDTSMRPDPVRLVVWDDMAAAVVVAKKDLWMLVCRQVMRKVQGLVYRYMYVCFVKQWWHSMDGFDGWILPVGL